MITATSVISATNAWDNYAMTLLVIGVVVLVVAVLASFVVGLTVGQKRSASSSLGALWKSGVSSYHRPLKYCETNHHILFCSVFLYSSISEVLSVSTGAYRTRNASE